jgi:hypothetical protein
MKNTTTPPWHRIPKFQRDAKRDANEIVVSPLRRKVTELASSMEISEESASEICDEQLTFAGRLKPSELIRQETADWKIKLNQQMKAENRPLTVAGFNQKKKEVKALRLLALTQLKETVVKKEKTKITNTLCELRNSITQLRIAAGMARSQERKNKKSAQAT